MIVIVLAVYLGLLQLVAAWARRVGAADAGLVRCRDGAMPPPRPAPLRRGAAVSRAASKPGAPAPETA